MRTLYFNLNYFPLKIAVKIPVFIYKGVRLKNTKGTVELDFTSLEPGSVRIGSERYGFQTNRDYTIWEQLGGRVIFGSGIVIGKGTFLSIGKNGVLKFGSNIGIGGNDKIICRKSIEIGDHTITAWDVQIIDTDFHHTSNTIFNTMNCVEKPIVIGKYNWLCLGSAVLKGSITPNHCIVSANTTIKNDYSKAGENIILGQEPGAKVTAKYIRFDEKSAEEMAEKNDTENVVKIKAKRSKNMKDYGS